MVKVRWLVLVALTLGCSVHQEDAVAAHPDRLSADDQGRIANLARAARYPWRDDGLCAVREASGDWATLVERCYGALDLHRIRFVDYKAACPIAQAGAISAEQVTQLVGICLLTQPELAVPAVIVVGTVVVAAAIAAELRKLPCKCVCMSIDARGTRHGPYDNGDRKNQYDCEQSCLKKEYAGGGFCR